MPGPKTQALLAYLAARPRTYRRQELYDQFCANADDPAAALRWHLSRLRRWLGAPLVVAEDESVRFNHEAARVDSVEFAQTLSGDLSPQSEASRAAAVDAYHGEFLAGAALPDMPEFELWLLGERTRLHEYYERGLSELIARLIAVARYADAIARAQQLVQANPLLEQAHARLIWLYAQTGQRHAALQQFDIARDWLRRELAVEPTAEFQALREAVLAGRPGPALAPASAAAHGDWRQTTDFVGREAELAHLASAWDAARAGRGSALLIEAEAGGGKTRLVSEFVQPLAASDAAIMLSGQCYESTRALPYRPWIDVLESRLAQLSDQALRTLSPFWLEQLARLVPTLNARLSRRAATAAPTAGVEVEHLFGAVNAMLSSPSPRPLLIFIDNLQWADEASLRLFQSVARRSRNASTLLIGTFRSEEAADSPALQSLLGDLRRDGLTHLRLAPLSLEAIATLTATLWPRLPEGYRPHVCALLAHATGGNPLFVSEVLRELAHGAEMPRAVPVPASVRELIQRRLRALPASAQQVVEAMAVADSPLTLAEAQQASARSEDEAVAALDSGLRSGLLLAQGERAARYDFSHDLLREAVVVQLSDVRRCLLHRRLASMLAQQAGRIPTTQRDELAGRIVRHALAGDAAPLVLAWAPAAAQHAQRLGAYADALAHYEAAADALAQLHADDERGSRRELELLLKRAEMQYHLGRRADERVLLEQAAGLLACDPHADLEAEYHLREAAFLNSTNADERAYQSAQQAYETYVRLEEPRRAAEALHYAGDAEQSRGDARAALALNEQSLALYRQARDRRGEARLLAEIGWALVDLGEIERALTYLAQALQICEQQGDVAGGAYAAFVMAVAWSFYYRADKIRAYALQARQGFQSMGNDAAAARAQLYLAVSDYAEVKLDTARENFLRTFEQAQAAGDGWCEGWCGQMLGRLAVQGGDLAHAEHWLMHAYELRRAHHEAHNTVSDLAWLGRLCLAQAQPAQALAHTSEAMARLGQISAQAHVWELQDVYLAHAEALSAGRADASPFIQNAYQHLKHIADGIADPATRECLCTYPTNARIIAAWQRGYPKPFPD